MVMSFSWVYGSSHSAVSLLQISLPQGYVSLTGLWVSYRVISLPQSYEPSKGFWVSHRVMGLLLGYGSHTVL